MTPLAKKVIELFGKPDADKTTRTTAVPSSARQAKNSDPRDAQEPFFPWLLEHHPEHYHAICTAEDTLTTLEKEGMTDGLAYRLACDDLHQRFEAACKLVQRERRPLQTSIQ